MGAYSITKVDCDINLVIDSANYVRGQCNVGHKSVCVHYNEEFRIRLKAEKDLENDMAESLKNSEFQVYYQAKVNCNTQRIVGAEALVRWHHGGKGIICPMDFIELLNNENFAEELSMIADHYGIPHAFLEIEITETIAIGDTKAVKNLFKALKEKNFIIAIDDFGSGYSSLSILSQLAIDTIKIDRSFIHNAMLSVQDQLILSGIVNIAHAMKKQLVCEGVETEEQIKLLQSIDCSIIQGFYYSQPIHLTDFELLIEEFKGKF